MASPSVALLAVLLSVKEYPFVPQSVPLVKTEGIFMQAKKAEGEKIE